MVSTHAARCTVVVPVLAWPQERLAASDPTRAYYRGNSHLSVPDRTQGGQSDMQICARAQPHNFIDKSGSEHVIKSLRDTIMNSLPLGPVEKWATR